MYRHCIYCSADLGTNEAVEAFPIGRTLAFDAAKGRLWAVCGKCGRWNLAPLEEHRGSAESVERLFRDARRRVQSENVGLAKLSDGTRLVRIGAAPREELAAWRYGDELVKGRRQNLVLGAAVATAVIAAAMGIGFVAVGLLVMAGVFLRTRVVRPWWMPPENPLVHAFPAHESPDGEPLYIRRLALGGAVLRPDERGGIELHLACTVRRRGQRVEQDLSATPLVLPDRAARRLLERLLVRVNGHGANRSDLGFALRRLTSAGSAEEYIRTIAASGLSIGGDAPGRKLTPPMLLALEMALHEEQERRALGGEIAVLQDAWRDAAPSVAAVPDRFEVEVA